MNRADTNSRRYRESEEAKAVIKARRQRDYVEMVTVTNENDMLKTELKKAESENSNLRAAMSNERRRYSVRTIVACASVQSYYFVVVNVFEEYVMSFLVQF